jgi:hypothetical protein
MEGAPADDNFDALPLEDQLTHKVRADEANMRDGGLGKGRR